MKNVSDVKREGKYKDRVNIQFLENLVSGLVKKCETAGDDLLKKHFDWKHRWEISSMPIMPPT